MKFLKKIYGYMEIFSTIDLVNQCLIDKERVNAFKKAILKLVRKGSNVLEVGIGSGVLSLIAAKAGAEKIYAIEIDPFVAKTAKKIIRENGYDSIIKIIMGDATKIKINTKEKIDIIIAETLTTGMIDEQQVNIINNLHRQKIISSQTKIIPYRIDTHVSLINADYKLYGFNFPMVKHIWKQYNNNPRLEKLSKKALLSSYCFDNLIEENFSREIKFKINRAGILNGLLLESRAWFLEKIYCTNTVAFLAPIIFPLDKTKLKKGDEITFKISYKFGEGFDKFKVIRKNKKN